MTKWTVVNLNNRFYDTNLEAEMIKHIDQIQDIVQWMGWEPYKVAYTSDYFQALYDHALELIWEVLAWVGHHALFLLSFLYHVTIVNFERKWIVS